MNLLNLLTAALRPRSPLRCGASRLGLPEGRACGMALGSALGLASFALLLGAPPAQAQNGQTGLYWQCQPISTTNPQGGYCPVSNAYPLPQGPAINALLPVAGAQVGVTISSATGMTIPTGATVALVQAQGTQTAAGVCLFWRDDGTDPSATAGQALGAAQSIWIKTSAAFKMFAATGATCTASISYYK